MVKKILWQKGIPHEFFQPGFEQVFFQNDQRSIVETFIAHSDTEAIFFRANFVFLPEYFNQLKGLKYAVLVSTGTDNVPIEEFARRGIQFCSAEGANARAVAEYVIQALFLLWQKDSDLISHGVGIIGKGRIGTLLVDWLMKNKIPVSWYDPFLQGSGSLNDALAKPVVSFHVPLTRAGEHATRQMLNAAYFAKASPWIIQASRGEIWDTAFYSSGDARIWAQDVFPIEPPPANDLKCANYNTPHVAGYSTQGRLGGITKGLKMIFPQSNFALPQTATPWYLEDEHMTFLHNYAGLTSGLSAPAQQNLSYFNARRDNFPYRKEFADYTQAEREQFTERFGKIPQNLISSLWSLHEI